MPEVETVGAVIASREMEFAHKSGRKEKAFLRVGVPFEYGQGFDWCCPYELSTETSKKLSAMFGIDALQALQPTLKTLPVEIEYWERTNNGKFYFLDEEGSAV